MRREAAEWEISAQLDYTKERAYSYSVVPPHTVIFFRRGNAEAMLNATPTTQLADAGVSIWLDERTYERVPSVILQKLIDRKNVDCVVTNLSIFRCAINPGTDHEEQIAELAAQGASLEETLSEITTTDLATLRKAP